MKKRIAIIGASSGQLALCLKARDMGVETFCFAWDDGAVCKDYVDHFIPISIFDKDEIVQYCRSVRVDGVVSNASESTAQIVAYVAEQLGCIGVPYQILKNIQQKNWVREVTNALDGLSPVEYVVGRVEDIVNTISCPYVMKPISGSAKKGVNFVESGSADIHIPEELREAVFMAEKYVEGREYSVETISYRNTHTVVQITEKISTGAPHFVELEHHQPAALPVSIVEKLNVVVPRILSAVGFVNGASHIEVKINDDGEVFLIEINPRGGGDYISNDLVGLSTDCDYLQQMILVALDMFKPIKVNNVACSGIYFLSEETSRLLPSFDGPQESWMIKRERTGNSLTKPCSNYDHDGFIMYCSNNKIVL